MIPAYLLVGIGVALITTPALTDALNVAPADKRGQAAGVVGTVQQLGATVGVAVITASLAPIFDSELSDRVGAQKASEIETALSKGAGGSESGQPAAVVADAKDSFSKALSLSYVIVVVLMLASCLLAFVHPRGPPPARDPGAPPVVG
jgi:hypothetical protein